ncbi:MAG: sugar phosphate nucleotidyltransferase, partial [Myxococcota bacterium]
DPIHPGMEAVGDRIYVLTQYLSASLNRHVGRTYRFDAFSNGHVTVLAAEQTPHGSPEADWYEGTADAVRKMLHRFDADRDDDVLILSGDQVYAMDLAELLKHHRNQKADLTIAATRVGRSDVKRFGVIRTDEQGRVLAFAEKPRDPDVVDSFVAPDAPSEEMTHLASMGIYAFRFGTLVDLLGEDNRNDFGHNILPTALETGRALTVYPFEGFWEDVGTISSYHRVNLELTTTMPGFNLFDEQNLIYTRARFLPPSKVGDAHVEKALVCPGAIVGDGSRVQQSVLGIRMVVGTGCTLDRVVANGAGWYDFDGHTDSAPDGLPLGIGANSNLRNCIIDRDVRIGPGVTLVNADGVDSYDDDVIAVRNGIIVVASRSTVPAGYTF